MYIDALYESAEFDYSFFVPDKYKLRKDLKSYVKFDGDLIGKGYIENLNHIIDYMNMNGPFDGMIGFSMGANTI